MKYQVDFDGVLAYHEHNMPAGEIGHLLKSGCYMLDSLIKAGHEVSILTARDPVHHVRISEWIYSNTGHRLRVSNIKEPADGYIDDKAIPWMRNLE